MTSSEKKQTIRRITERTVLHLLKIAFMSLANSQNSALSLSLPLLFPLPLLLPLGPALLLPLALPLTFPVDDSGANCDP